MIYCYIFTGQHDALAVSIAPEITVPTLCQQLHVALSHAEQEKVLNTAKGYFFHPMMSRILYP